MKNHEKPWKTTKTEENWRKATKHFESAKIQRKESFPEKSAPGFNEKSKFRFRFLKIHTFVEQFTPFFENARESENSFWNSSQDQNSFQSTFDCN